MILKEKLWLMEEFFIGQSGEQEKCQTKEQGQGQKLSKREGENNPKAGFSAQETKSMNNTFKWEAVWGFVDLVLEF